MDCCKTVDRHFKVEKTPHALESVHADNNENQLRVMMLKTLRGQQSLYI